MIYWEVVPKYVEPSSDELLVSVAGGPEIQRNLLPQMILVCAPLVNNLNYSNGFFRGFMLQF